MAIHYVIIILGAVTDLDFLCAKIMISCRKQWIVDNE